MKKYFLLLFLIFLPSIAFSAAQTYYVTQSGAGSYSGTSLGNAWSVSNFNNSSNWSATESTSKIDPGDTVYFSGTITSQLVLAGSGAAGAYITLDGYEGGSADQFASVDGDTNCATLSTGSSTEAIEMNHKDYISIQDFRITTVADGIEEVASSSDQCHYIYLTRLYIFEAAAKGIRFTTTNSGYRNGWITIEECVIRNTAEADTGSASAAISMICDDLVIRRNHLYNDLSGYEMAAYSGVDGIVVLESTNVLIEYNTVSYMGEDAVDFKSDSAISHGNVIVRYNDFFYFPNQTAVTLQHVGGHHGYVYGNRMFGHASDTDYMLYSYGVLVYRAFQYAFIWSNLIYDTARAGIAFYNDDTRIPKNIYIYNNTIVNSNTTSSSTSDEHAGVRALACDGGTNHIANNIFVDNNLTEGYNTQIFASSNTAPYTTVWNNLYWATSGVPKIDWDGTTYSTVAAWQSATGNGTDDAVADPSFVNYSSRDLRLASDSNAIGTATEISDNLLPSYASRITIQGTTYCNNSGGTCDELLSFSTALDPNNTDWTTIPPTVATLDQDDYGSWEKGAYVYTTGGTSAPNITSSADGRTNSCPTGSDPISANFWLITDINSYCRGGLMSTNCAADYPGGYDDLPDTYDNPGTTNHGYIRSEACGQAVTVCAACSTQLGDDGYESAMTTITRTIDAEDEPGPSAPITMKSDTSGNTRVTVRSDTGGNTLITLH